MPPDETLRSRDNPLYKRLRALKERASERDLCLLEGPRLVLEALAAGLAVVEAVASPRAEASPAGAAALSALRGREVPLTLYGPAGLRELLTVLRRVFGNLTFPVNTDDHHRLLDLVGLSGLGQGNGKGAGHHHRGG